MPQRILDHGAAHSGMHNCGDADVSDPPPPRDGPSGGLFTGDGPAAKAADGFLPFLRNIGLV